MIAPVIDRESIRAHTFSAKLNVPAGDGERLALDIDSGIETLLADLDLECAQHDVFRLPARAHIQSFCMHTQSGVGELNISD